MLIDPKQTTQFKAISVSRIERLEIRVVPERQPEPPKLVFVGTDRRPVSALRWNKDRRGWDKLDLSGEKRPARIRTMKSLARRVRKLERRGTDATGLVPALRSLVRLLDG